MTAPTDDPRAPPGVPPGIERRIRSAGAVLDMALTREIYAPLLAAQRRDGVEVARDLAYGADARHRLDVYRPPSDSGVSRPVLIFLHGGGFIRGDKSDRENVGQYFARRGFVVIVPNYRLAPAAVWPAGAEDVAAVCHWAQVHAGARGGDLGRLFLCGESAGAAHVAAATLVRRLQPPGGLRLAGAALISGVYNPRLEFLSRREFGIATPDPRNDAYYGADGDRLAAMSTVDLIDAAPLPLLITYAELDMPQMQVQAGELYARLVVRHGFSPVLRVVRGHNHLTQVYSVNTGDESLASVLAEFFARPCPTSRGG